MSLQTWKRLMLTRTHRKTLIFYDQFSLEGIGRLLLAGNYEIVTDVELIEGRSFPVWRQRNLTTRRSRY